MKQKHVVCDQWFNDESMHMEYMGQCCNSLAYNTVRYRYNAVNFHSNTKKTPHSSPVRASYGVSFVGKTSDAYSASVIILPCGPRYNGIRPQLVDE